MYAQCSGWNISNFTEQAFELNEQTNQQTVFAVCKLYLVQIGSTKVLK